jgi:uncharacterized membrane protein YeaQ/YmgE (transglycosylase-associated protein family)
MSFLVWLILGVTIGYLGHLVLTADPDRGAFINILVGTAGVLGSSRLMASYMSAAAIQRVISRETGLICLVSFLVAMVLVGATNLLCRRKLCRQITILRTLIGFRRRVA